MHGPLVIAHRGLPGTLPEHSYAGYAAAHALGADLIELDVVLSRDGTLICLHDLQLATTIDVARVFPDRADADGRFHACDFTVEELHRLTIQGREGNPIPGLRIPTLDGTIDLLTRLNRGSGRRTGLIVEPKSPALDHHRVLEIELRLARRLETLAGIGVRAILQTFDLDALERVHERHPTVERVFLTDTDLSDAILDRVAAISDGLGPAWSLLTEGTLHQRAGERGIRLYPWTFGADDTDVRRAASLGVAGIFTDYTDRALRVLGRAQAETDDG